MRSLLMVVAKSLITTLIFLVIAEGAIRTAYAVRNAMVRYVPLPYAVGDDYGPIPPWLDRLLILTSDDQLIWKSAPNVRRTYVDIFSPVRSDRDRMALLRRFNPALPSEFAANPQWDISLNSNGDRSPEYAAVPAAGTIRIACIGDSWTFGMPVKQAQTYPSRLGDWLQSDRPDERFEVLNFGVLGYSSFQGLQVLKRRVLDVHPSIVAIGFGMNDSEVAGYRDKDMVGGTPARPTLAGRAATVINGLESFKLLKYEALALKFRPKSMAEYLKRDETSGGGPVNYDDLEPWTRVSPHDFEANIREMVDLARGRGAAVVLLDNELWDASPYRPVLHRLADDLHVPLVDSYALITAGREAADRQEEARHGLAPASSPAAGAPAPSTTVVFRVDQGTAAVPKALSIVGADAVLGTLVPNAVLLHDDGKDGDERAGDHVWSYAAAFPPSTRIKYVYTNSGSRGQWEGLDVPHIRTVDVPPSDGRSPVYLSIETFGRVYLQGDSWHTDAAGYDLIARAAARAIESIHP